MARTFEQLFRWLTPGWLRAGDGDAVLRSLARQLDENVARFRAGLNARFPTRCNDDSTLAQIGADRGIPRGRVESSDAYAARLVAWRHPYGHRVRGSAYALLEQLSIYFGGAYTQSEANGLLSAYTPPIGGPAATIAYLHAFDWDDQPPSNWARFWLKLDAHLTPTGIAVSPSWGDPDLFGGSWGNGISIGQTGLVFDDVQAIRRLFEGRAWKPSGTQPEWLVINFGTTFTPDGTYARWSKMDGTAQVPARDPYVRYISLDPLHNNTTRGDHLQFCETTLLVDRTSYGGDPDSFPEDVALPNGSTYSGDGSKFPLDVRLVDDGDPT